jgi:hypothetical protein
MKSGEMKLRRSNRVLGHVSSFYLILLIALFQQSPMLLSQPLHGNQSTIASSGSLDRLPAEIGSGHLSAVVAKRGWTIQDIVEVRKIVARHGTDAIWALPPRCERSSCSEETVGGVVYLRSFLAPEDRPFDYLCGSGEWEPGV